MLGAARLSSNFTRRNFLKTSATAGAGLLLPFHISGHAGNSKNAGPLATAPFSPNAWLELSPEGDIKIWCGKSELGQGVRTALPMIVAEELCCEWRRVRVAPADLEPKYGEQLTGGSLSVRTSYQSLRKAGAAAREMLITAAAADWNVSRSECRAESSFVTHNSLAKATGAAKFGLDTRLPGMLIASMERSPVYGGTPLRFNADEVKSAPCVRAVLEVKSAHLTHQFGDTSGPGSRNYSCAGVAVVADSTWAAIEARKLLKVEWHEPPSASETSVRLREKMLRLASESGTVIRNDGDFDQAHRAAANKIEAVYEVPFLAHATMEPVNCTAHVRGDSCELWAPTQIPGAAAESVASALGIPRGRVKVHVTLIGGGFGRRLIQDYAVEAALISRDAGAPVQVVWTREDDIRHDFYRPAACHVLQAGLDAEGQLVSWRHRASSPSIETFYNGAGISPRAAAQVDSLDFPAHFIPNFRLEFTVAESGMPLGYWRSVDASGNQFVLSSFFDEAAHAAARDPLEFLLAAFGPARKIPVGNGETLDVGRRRRVIELAAEKADWPKPLTAGRGRGIAAAFGWGSYVAQVAEVTCDAKKGALRVDRVVCAVDCGTAVNPLGVKAQMEGAINFGLAQALKSAITVSGGRVEQSNFHDYEVLGMSDAPPNIEVHIVDSSEPPGGCGEPGVPPAAPALANAIFAATGKRVRRLPMRAADLRSA